MTTVGPAPKTPPAEWRAVVEVLRRPKPDARKSGRGRSPAAAALAALADLDHEVRVSVEVAPAPSPSGLAVIAHGSGPTVEAAFEDAADRIDGLIVGWADDVGR